MKLLVDMNLSPRWPTYLADAGFEAVHWSEIGPIDAPDSIIMEYARKNDFVILTHDLDFGAILAASGDHTPSVVQIRSDNLALDAIGVLIVGALRQMEEPLTRGALVTIDAIRTRVTILPIGAAS